MGDLIGHVEPSASESKPKAGERYALKSPRSAGCGWGPASTFNKRPAVA
jgi:hypothetical protein